MNSTSERAVWKARSRIIVRQVKPQNQFPIITNATSRPGCGRPKQQPTQKRARPLHKKVLYAENHKHWPQLAKTITMSLQQAIKLEWAIYRPQPASITIYASKLAACAGMNPYASPAELKKELLRALGAAPEYMTPSEQADDLMSSLPAEQQQHVQQALQATHDDPTAVQSTLDDLSRLITSTPNIPTESKDLLVHEVRNRLFVEHGKHCEDNVRHAYEREARTKVATSAQFKVSREPLMSVRGVEVFLGGKHDGVVEDDVIVEIKTRLRRFLGTPTYDLVQLHAYMHIYGKTRGVLVESFNKEERCHEVAFDGELWKSVLAGLGAFLDDVFGSVPAVLQEVPQDLTTT